MFCPKCGSILVPKKEDNKRVLACSCGYKTDKTSGATIKEITGKKSRRVEVVEHGELDTLPNARNAAIRRRTIGWGRRGQATSLKQNF